MQWRIVVKDGRIVEVTEVVGVEGSRVSFERYLPLHDTVFKTVSCSAISESQFRVRECDMLGGVAYGGGTSGTSLAARPLPGCPSSSSFMLGLAGSQLAGQRPRVSGAEALPNRKGATFEKILHLRFD